MTMMLLFWTTIFLFKTVGKRLASNVIPEARPLYYISKNGSPNFGGALNCKWKVLLDIRWSIYSAAVDDDDDGTPAVNYLYLNQSNLNSTAPW